MQRVRNVVAVGLLAFAIPVQAADWLGDDINEVLSKVRSVYTTVVGDVKDTAQDLKRQLTSLAEKGQTLKDTVDDVLEFLRHRRTPFQDFVNGGAGRCGDKDLQQSAGEFCDVERRYSQRRPRLGRARSDARRRPAHH